MAELRKRVRGKSYDQPASKEQKVDVSADDEEPTINEQRDKRQREDDEAVRDLLLSQSIMQDPLTQPAPLFTPEVDGYDMTSNIELICQSIKQEPLSPTPVEKHETEDEEAVRYLLLSQNIEQEPLSSLNFFNEPADYTILQSIKQEGETHAPVNMENHDADDDVIRGIEEFNPNYLPREQKSSNNTDLSSTTLPQTRDESEVEQTGAAGFSITEQQSAHVNYLSTITLHPKKRTGDILQILEDLNQPLTDHITALLSVHNGIKVFLVLDVEYESISDATKSIIDHLHTHFFPVFSVAEIPQLLAVLKEELVLKNENFVQFKSGLRLKNIAQVTVSAAEHQPLAGTSFQELPPFLAKKKCIINIKNQDNRCFGFALLASLEARENNLNNPRSYNQHFAKHNLNALAYPVKISDIPAIEANLPFAVNVFSFDDDIGQSRFPIYVSPKLNVRVIDLLYWNEHYALITNFNRFMCDITKHKERQHFCRRCFGHFTKETTLVNHQRYCLGFHGCKTNIRMPPENSKCEFKNIKNQLKCPFVVYADFECLLPQNQNQSAAQPGKTVPTQKHIPFSVGFKLVGPDLRTPTNQDVSLDYSNFPYEFHTGEHSAEWLLMRLMKLESTILKVIFNDELITMNEEDNLSFEAAIKCHICDKGWELDVAPDRRAPDATENLDSGDNESDMNEEKDEDEEEDEDQHQQAEQTRIRKWEKVRDHDHLTGKYRGAAHNHCNLQYRKQFKIPVFFHNLRNYDGHLIVRAMENFPKYQIKPIAQGLEKYLIIGWGRHLIFKDTLQFMAASLEQLAKNLLDKGKENFVQLTRGFKETAARMDLILRKGVFPYDFMRNWQSVDFRMLPSRQNFYNNLKQAECPVEEYEHARTVWREFGCQTMKDYSELYMKTGMIIFLHSPFFNAIPFLFFF